MPLTICVNCGVIMNNIQSGVASVETFGLTTDPPYKVWRSDKYECRKCGVQVLTGFGNKPSSEHFNADFNEEVEVAKQDGGTFGTY